MASVVVGKSSLCIGAGNVGVGGQRMCVGELFFYVGESRKQGFFWFLEVFMGKLATVAEQRRKLARHTVPGKGGRSNRAS